MTKVERQRRVKVGTETASDLAASLASDVCPMCGGYKPAGLMVTCEACWSRVPQAFRRPLVASSAGAAFADAFRRALLGLGVWEMRLPPSETTRDAK